MHVKNCVSGFTIAALTLILAIAPSWESAQARARADSPSPQIWFNLTNYKMSNGVDGPQGWNKLFVEPGAPWPAFMNHVQVVAGAGIAQIPDDVLAKVFVKLDQHHIPFAIESLAQSWVHEPECGHGVESYYDPPGARKIAEKIKAAGGELAYVAMDEPLFYGRYYNGHDACHSSIENVAERAAAIIREYKKVFPNLIVGDIEPFPAITDQRNWQNEYRQWMNAFNAALGQPIAFLQIDINWGHDNWPQSLKKTVHFAGSAHLPTGIIYNGDSHRAGGTSEGWLESAVQNFTRIEKEMGIHPDQAIFHSWGKFPIHSISDPSGPGEDYLVKRYLQQRGVQ
jgi:hypothetical protein